MQAPRLQGKDGRSSPLAVAAAVMALISVMVLIWLSADPEAHERFHHGASHEGHHCIVTEFSVGEAYYLAPDIVVRPRLANFDRNPRERRVTMRETVEFTLLPSCGPPVLG